MRKASNTTRAALWGCLTELRVAAWLGNPMYLDAEIRSFLGRPPSGHPLSQVLRVVVSTAAVVAVVKIGWILADYAIRG